jgi:large subunit ribosomal protein L9
MAKLLLLVDIDSLGRSGDIVSVKPGYARNFLLPNGHGVVADNKALKMQARLQEERRLKAIEDKKESEVLAGKLETIHLTVVVKVDHEGHMYGSVTVLDVAHLLKEQAGVEIEKKNIGLKQAVKEIGIHTIPVKLKEGVQATVTLKVVSEAGAADASKASA